MKKKLIVSITIMFVFSLFSFGQPAKIKKGEKLYDFYSYTESIEKYEQISDKTIDIKRQLADSYFRINDYENSEKYYADIVNSDDRTAEDIYNYAYILSINEKYTESSKWMKKYNSLNPSDKRGVLFIENEGFFRDLQKDNGTFIIKNLVMNTQNEDFGVAYYKNQVVFCSTRSHIKPIKRKWNWNNLPFLDLYIASIDSSSSELTGIQFFRKKLNKKYHEGPVAFNESGDYMVLTRNNYKNRSSDGISKLQMFYSVFDGKKWDKPIPMPFNDKEYSVGHATLSADGQTMYFASDMPGGIGGVDIYKSIRNGDTWGTPVNLGREINTEGNEMFPFLHSGGYLFFSSDGWLGLGGLDVFAVKIDGDNIGKIKNLGAPISSNTDDFAFILDYEMKSGFFSSNREEGKGDDDIYKFTLTKAIFSGKLIQGVATDTEDNILSEVEVNLYDENGNIVATVVTTETGEYEFTAEQNKIYKLDGKKVEYSDGKNSADTHSDDYIIIADLVLEAIPEISLYCLINDAETNEALDSVSITLINNHTKTEEKILTPTTGDFLRNLEGLKLNDSISYTLKLNRNGYFSKKFTYSELLDHEGQYDIINNMEKMKVGLDLKDLIDMNPIYFDLGKHDIRPDAAIELDKIVEVMNKYPTMEIELGAHTDSRGSDASNRALSQRRATSSAEYIKQRITNPNRITGKGYGETKKLTVTQETHDKYDFLPVGQILDNNFIYSLTKEQQEIAHQLNRRTEFVIIKN